MRWPRPSLKPERFRIVFSGTARAQDEPAGLRGSAECAQGQDGGGGSCEGRPGGSLRSHLQRSTSREYDSRTPAMPLRLRQRPAICNVLLRKLCRGDVRLHCARKSCLPRAKRWQPHPSGRRQPAGLRQSHQARSQSSPISPQLCQCSCQN